VLNANYLLAGLRDEHDAARPPVMHEFVLSARTMKREHGSRRSTSPSG
jgi:glycine cleavage system protein P-like pyridoxal-binding family